MGIYDDAVASWGVGVPLELWCFLRGQSPWAFGPKMRIPTQLPASPDRWRNLGTGTEGVEQGGKREGLLREGMALWGRVTSLMMGSVGQ